MSGCKMCVRVAVFEAYYFFLFLCILIFVLPFLIVPYLVYLSSLCHSFSFYFFVQAEDGIRYIGVDWSSDVCSSDLWPLAIVQTCVRHLVRNTFRLASRADWDAIARDLRPVYVAPTEQAAKERLGEFAASWAAK